MSLKKRLMLSAIIMLMTGLTACRIINPNEPSYDRYYEAFYEYEDIDAEYYYANEDGTQPRQYVHEHIEYDGNLYDDYDESEALPLPTFTAEPLPYHIIEFIRPYSFSGNPPFSYDFLTYLTITHVDFDGESRIGHMIVADEIGDEVLDIFREIYYSGFPIYSIRLIDYFYADDKLSLEANNSSAFNFRYIAGTNIISRHGFGMAIDINPIQNPYVRGDNVLPEAGREYLDRDNVRPGMIVPGDAVYTAFTSRDWIWGGNWTMPWDLHHFERRH